MKRKHESKNAKVIEHETDNKQKKENDTWICLTWNNGNVWYKRYKGYKGCKREEGKRKTSLQSKLLSLL